MSSYRKIYNQIGLYCGPSPSTGYNYLDFNGNPTNSIYCNANGLTGYSYNLIQPIVMVQSFAYSIDESRIDLKNLGFNKTMARPSISYNPVSFNYSYIPIGLINEARMGFSFNYPSGNVLTNNPISTGNIPFLSGFYDRSNLQTNIFNFTNNFGSNVSWPRTQTDSRNFFIATSDYLTDFNSSNILTQTLNNTTGTFITAPITVYSFGNSFIDSYQISFSVGSLPIASCSYTCDNFISQAGGSGNISPYSTPKSFQLNPNNTYSLPCVNTGIVSYSPLLPSNVTFFIKESNGSGILSNLPINSNDLKLQRFDISINFNREPLFSVGFPFPIDRPLNYPIFANLSLTSLVGDSMAGSLYGLLFNDVEYDIKIDLKYPSYSKYKNSTAISYLFKNAKFNSSKSSDSIGSNRISDLSFSCECVPNSTTKGFFISGLLGVDQLNYPLY